MFIIQLHGQLETKNPQEFLDKFNQLLKETGTTYDGIMPHILELPPYIDFQKIEEAVNQKDIESDIGGTINKEHNPL